MGLPVFKHINAEEQIFDGTIATSLYALRSVTVAVMNIDGNLTFNNNQALNFRLENVSSLPAAGNPGRLVLDTTNNTIYVDTGLSFQPISGGGTPGGSSGDIQFNDSGVFSGDSNLTYSNGTLTLGKAPVFPISTFLASSTLIVPDYTSNGNTLNFNNSIPRSSDVPAQLPSISSSLALDGTDVGTNSILGTADNLSTFSVSFWIKFTYVSSRVEIIGKVNSSPNYGWFFWTETNGDVNFAISGLVGQSTIATSPLNDGNWHNIVGTFTTSGSNNMNLYVDGSLASSSTTGTIGSFAADNPVKVADTMIWSPSYTGKLVDARIYSVALSSVDVSSIFSGGDPESSFKLLEWVPASIAIDAQLSSTVIVTVDDPCVLSGPINPYDGQKLTFRFDQDSTGHAVTLATGSGNFRFGSDITSFTASGANLKDYVGIIWDNSATIWDVVSVIRGF